MAKVTLMPSGINAAIQSGHKRKPGARGKCLGWSAGACRRNARFLRSVVPDSLYGNGYACTLTVRDLPSSAIVWAQVRDAFLKRVRRMGVIRFHWVTEWTSRGVPHLHLVLFFHPSDRWIEIDVRRAWMDVAGFLGTGPQGQCIKRLDDAVGWFGYVSKHSARGAAHYQRQAAALPDTWDTVGRVWGKGGDWVVQEVVVEIEDDVFHVLRRLVRGWLTAQARSDVKREKLYGKKHRIEAAQRRVFHARNMLKCTKKELSGVRGLGHWVNGDAQEELLSAAWLIDAQKKGLR